MHLALDDFGVGWSSLAMLERLPLDALKIDRSFIAALSQPATRMAGRPQRAAGVLRAVGDLGPALGLITVAEGIETPSHLAAATAAGFGAAQGFLLSRPVPAPDVAQLLNRRQWAPTAAVLARRPTP